MSPRRRRGEDEFADEQPWLAEDDEDTGPWPPEDDAGPWPPAEDGDRWTDSPGRASGGGRRGRHSGAADPPPRGGSYEPPAAGPPPGWDEPLRGDPGREDHYALSPEPEPPAPRRAASWEQDPRARDRYQGGTARNGLPGDPYAGPPRSGPVGQDPGPRAAGRRSRGAAPPGNARPPAGYPDSGDRYAGRSRADRPAGYSSPAGQYGDHGGGQYRDPDGHYGDQSGRYGDQSGRYGNSNGHYGDQGGQYHDPNGQYRDRGDWGRDPGGSYGDPAGRSGDYGRGYDDSPGPPDAPAGRRPGSRGRYAGAGDDYPPPDRGRDPRAGRSGPADAGYGGRDARDGIPDQEDQDWDDDSYQDEGWPFGADAGDGGSGRRPKRKRRGRWAGPSSLLVVAAIILIPVIIGGIYAYRVISSHYNPPNYSGDGTGQVIFQVKTGDTSLTVGDRLVTDGVVASSRALVLAAEHSSNSNMLQPGFYRLHKHMNAQLAWNLLLSPSARVQLKVTIPEGYRVPQVLAALSKQSGIPASDFNKAIKDTSALGLPSYAKGNPEGYLFPATYDIQPHMTAVSVLKAMVTAFNQEAASINLPKAAAKGHLTPAEAIVVASLAQAEGGKVSDFPKITRVIYNRLNAHMPLELDSTVLYALHTYGILASNQQLKVKSPYNTYTHQGLPPAPIDSPGNAAIQAALHPAKGNWLYFVTVNPKTKQTDFTNSPTVFQQLKNQLQQYLSSHGG